MTDEQEILRKLLVDKKDVIKDMVSIVEKVKEIFVIEKETGRVIFTNISALNDSQRISALLLGRHFALKLELIDFYPLGVSEMAEQLGRPKTALSGPLKELMTKGYVEKLPNKKYGLVYHRIKDISDLILKKK